MAPIVGLTPTYQRGLHSLFLFFIFYFFSHPGYALGISNLRSRSCRCQKPPDVENVNHDYELAGNSGDYDDYFLAMLGPSGTNGIMVDSGAALNACPPEHAETNVNRRVPHVKATTATGEAAFHRGGETVEYEFNDGTKGSNTYQEMNVSRPVLSVSEMNARGHTVVFESKGAYIIKSGKRLDLWRWDGAFYLTGKILNGGSPARIIADLETGESQDARAPVLPELPSKREQELHHPTHLPWRPFGARLESAGGDHRGAVGSDPASHLPPRGQHGRGPAAALQLPDQGRAASRVLEPGTPRHRAQGGPGGAAGGARSDQSAPNVTTNWWETKIN
jgi:hypothetical protein